MLDTTNYLSGVSGILYGAVYKGESFSDTKNNNNNNIGAAFAVLLFFLILYMIVYILTAVSFYKITPSNNILHLVLFFFFGYVYYIPAMVYFGLFNYKLQKNYSNNNSRN